VALYIRSQGLFEPESMSRGMNEHMRNHAAIT